MLVSLGREREYSWFKYAMLVRQKKRPGNCRAPCPQEGFGVGFVFQVLTKELITSGSIQGVDHF